MGFNAILVKAEIEAAEKRISDNGKRIVVTLNATIPGMGRTERVKDTLQLENESIVACRIGRARAAELARACGYDKRPDDISVLGGHEVNVKLSLDDDGAWRVLKYEACAGTDEPEFRF